MKNLTKVKLKIDMNMFRRSVSKSVYGDGNAEVFAVEIEPDVSCDINLPTHQTPTEDFSYAYFLVDIDAVRLCLQKGYSPEFFEESLPTNKELFYHIPIYGLKFL